MTSNYLSLFLSEGIDRHRLLRTLKIYTVLVIGFTVLAFGGFISTFHLVPMSGIANGGGDTVIWARSLPSSSAYRSRRPRESAPDTSPICLDCLRRRHHQRSERERENYDVSPEMVDFDHA